MEEIARISVVDTHEHLDSEDYRTSSKIDVFTVFMSHYLSSDLISCGMTHNDLSILRDCEEDLDRKWKLFEPYWELTRNTAYSRALMIAVKDLYGIEDLSRSSYSELDARLKNKNKKGVYKWILKEKSNIDISILNMLAQPRFTYTDYTDRFLRLDSLDGDFFLPVKSFDDFVRLPNNKFISIYERFKNICVKNLSDWVQQLEDAVAECKKKGIVAIKSTFAYSRVLRFDDIDSAEAEKIFNKVMITEGVELPADEIKPLQDYMMHRVLKLAEAFELPVQIHTGLQEGNGNYISNANPVHLTNLFIMYPNVQFDIFHGGYPYGSELAAIAKNFANVFIDMCWLHIISPEYSVRMLSEWLDTVPSNKIFGFGGDYIFAEGVYGHLQIARDNIARTLAYKVENRQLDVDHAIVIARRLLRENAIKFFRLTLPV